MCGMIADTANEASAFYLYVDRRGHEEFDAATEGVDVNLLVLGNHGLTQVGRMTYLSKYLGYSAGVCDEW